MDLDIKQTKAKKRKLGNGANDNDEAVPAHKRSTKGKKVETAHVEVGAEPVVDQTREDVEKVKKKKKKNKSSAKDVTPAVTMVEEASTDGGGNERIILEGDSPADVDEVVASKGKGKKKKTKALTAGDVGESVSLPGKQQPLNIENGSIRSETATVDGLEINVSGRGHEEASLQPVKTFSSAQLPPKVLAACGTFEKPSPIQSYAWPVLRGGRDFIGIARTGSGKTLAFGVPSVLHILAILKAKGMNATSGGPLCLMLAPTRELAQQISEVVADAGRPSNVEVVCVYGGTSKGPQRSALRKHPAVVVATPGRLLDLMEEGCCSVGSCSFVVLDEADRMLDLGFEPAIRAILKATPVKRQTVMLSATWPFGVGQLAEEFVRDPIKVTIGSQALTANHDVTQIVEVVEDRGRDVRLDALLREYHKSRKNRVLVFVLYKKEASRVESLLTARGWAAGAVHGDKGQADRTRAVAAFKDGSVPLLIATDVAARGLDIPDVEYVINYSFPLTTEDYVHRIGRTGRAGRKGVAHTFFTHNDRGRAGELVNVLREAGQKVPEELLKFGTTVKKKESKLYGAHFRELSGDAPKATKTTFADSDDE